MVQHDDKFFQKVADTFADFHPEAPANMYALVKKRYGILAFFTWNALSLNIYYLVLLASGVAGVFLIGENVAPKTAMPAKPLLLEQAILMKSQKSIAEVDYDSGIEDAVPESQQLMAVNTTSKGASKQAKGLQGAQVDVAAASVAAEPAIASEPAITSETEVKRSAKKERKSIKVNEVKEVTSKEN